MNGISYAEALVKARRYDVSIGESSVNEFFIEAADYICEAAIEEDVMLDEEVNFDLVVEAVIGLMSDEQLAMENVEDFVMEASMYILNEFKKVTAKKALEKATKHASRAAQSTVAGGVKADDRTKEAAKDLVKAVKIAKATGDETTLDKAKEVGKNLRAVRKDPTKEQFAKSVFAGKGRKVNPNKTEATSQVVKDKLSRRAAKKAAAEAAQKKAAEAAAKAVTQTSTPANDNISDAAKKTIGSKIADGAKAAGDWIRKNPGKTALGVGGAAALTGGTIYAAKKIAAKRKAAAAAKEEIKENYEYPEYMDLLEAVIAEFTSEEIVSENASELACEIADFLIESEIINEKIELGRFNHLKMDKDGNMVKQNPVIGYAKDAKDVVKSGVKSVGNAIGTGAGKISDFAKKHPVGAGAAAIGAGAVGAATAIAAKKIADKKKAAKQNQEEVKENYEYEEYETLVENVIGYFMSDEEIMSENANEIAMATADYFIENIDNM